jgi:hypothetical protein
VFAFYERELSARGWKIAPHGPGRSSGFLPTQMSLHQFFCWGQNGPWLSLTVFSLATGLNDQSQNQRLYKQQSYTVESLQGLSKDIFELDRCWMRGRENNRWLFAAMGVVIRMHQYRAWQAGPSTWAIKPEVLGR